MRALIQMARDLYDRVKKALPKRSEPRYAAVSARKVQHRNGKWVTITRIFDMRVIKPKEARKGKPWRHNETTNARRRWMRALDDKLVEVSRAP